MPRRQAATQGLSLLAGVRNRSEAIEQFFVAAHHAEHLARDPLLRRRIVLHLILVARQRVDDVLQRINFARHASTLPALMNEIRGAELATLDREHQAAPHQHGEQDPARDPATIPRHAQIPYSAPPGNSAAPPSCSSIRRSWLYFAIRSV